MQHDVKLGAEKDKKKLDNSTLIVVCDVTVPFKFERLTFSDSSGSKQSVKVVIPKL